MKTANLTERQIQDMKKVFTNIAKEEINLEITDDTFYVYGSELATLRLFKQYKEKATAEYSENLKTYFFTF